MQRRDKYTVNRLGPADDFGVYASIEQGEFNTPLVFRGTEAECQDAYMAKTREGTPWFVLRKRARLSAKRASRRAAGVGG